MKHVHVIPAPGLTILDPENYRTLPPEGARVPLTAYWRIAIRDKDVSIAPTPAKSTPSVAPAPAKAD